MNFELQLQEQKVKPHQVMALHLIAALAFAGMGAVFSLFNTSFRIWSVPLAVAGVVLLVITIARSKWIVQPAVNRVFRIVELLILAGLALFSVINQWIPPAVMAGVLSAAVLFALVWENGGQYLMISVDESGVKMPAGRTRRYINWVDIDEVLLKFGTLTINCADNRLYQWTVRNIRFDVPAFTAFCNRQIAAGRDKRDKNDW